MSAYATANALQRYQNDNVMMARPIELTIMLYDGLIKKLKLAKLYTEDHDYAMANKCFIGAQDIIDELLHSLDLRYEVSSSLMKLYDFMLWQTAQANMAKDVSLVEPVISVAENLREAWQGIRNECGHTYAVEE
ncbi:MAG: flagellar export chaperone FliS [Clostridia bacterium]|nr:flagellar export chaperone FliS [Clostridia bacterium]